MRRRTRVLLYSALALVLLVVAAVVAGVLVLRSDWFYGNVRDRIVAEVQKGSGGRAEIGRFHFDWKTMTASVAPFALHGKESAGEETFFRADAITVGLKVISAFRRDVDIATLVVERPRLNIIVYPDGSTNLPSPAKKSGKNPVETLINLAIGHVELRDGWFAFRDRKNPFDIRCDNLRAGLDYVMAGQFYRGHLSSRQFHFDSEHAGPFAFDFDTDLQLYKDRIEFPKTVLTAGNSRVDAYGVLRDIMSPRGDFHTRAAVSLSELGTSLRLPIEHQGRGTFDGRITFALAQGFTYAIEGRVDGTGLAYRDRTVQLSGARVNSAIRVTPDGLTASGVRAAVAGGIFAGSFEMPGFREFRLDGKISGVPLAEVARLRRTTVPWSGIASGPVRVTGQIAGNGFRNVNATADLAIAEAPGGIPVQGQVSVVYSQRGGGVTLGESHVYTASTRLDVFGKPGETLQVRMHSTDLRDLNPALELAGQQSAIPIELKGGTAIANLNISGPLNDPRVAGNVELTGFVWHDRRFDDFKGDIEVSRTSVQGRNLSLTDGNMRMTGSGSMALTDWKSTDDSSISADVNLVGVDVKKLLADAGKKDIPVSGTVSATARITGTLGAPQGEGRISAGRLVAYDEQFDSGSATFRLTGDKLDVASANLQLGQARIEFNGSYVHRPGDWTSGELSFSGNTKGLPVASVQHLRKLREDLSASLALQGSGTGRFIKGEFDLDSLNAQGRIQGISLDQSRFGNLQVSATTSGKSLSVRITGNLRDSKIEGSGEWQLAGDYPGRGELTFTRMRLATVKALAAKTAGTARDLPFEGSVEGSVRVSGPLKTPEKLEWSAVIPQLEIRASADQPIRAGANAQDLVLRNAGTVVIRGTTSRLTVENAQFTARDTKVDVAGTVAFNERSPWDLAVHGGINLAILQLFNPDLVARGSALVNATVKGALREPQLNGQLQLKDASLYLGDLPVGVDHAEGVVRFDANRATIQKLTAEVGGGKVALGGFVGFSTGLLTYRVQATAEQVRLRYPEGVSTTVNCALSLTGTSESSLVSGTVTIMRVGFTPKADIGGIIAASAVHPISAPETPSEFLRRIQLDVRVESGPSLEFTTSLARNIEADAQLRIRGTAARPVVLGSVSVTDGEVQLFGNKYEINRGEIRFLNPTRIEPFFDVDLQTRARGIDVTVSFSGTLNKLNMTYRSDPPLQSNEIIALLAMGRDPNATAGLASAQVASQSLVQTGSGALGEAISSPVSNRLQRFFGVSRLKIDPQLTGVENIPQARLTLEQQISRDITLTYITNLARTNEQIVRIEWDINRRWSAIATRQENGVFGIDFQYRKRFK